MVRLLAPFRCRRRLLGCPFKATEVEILPTLGAGSGTSPLRFARPAVVAAALEQREIRHSRIKKLIAQRFPALAARIGMGACLEVVPSDRRYWGRRSIWSISTVAGVGIIRRLEM